MVLRTLTKSRIVKFIIRALLVDESRLGKVWSGIISQTVARFSIYYYSSGQFHHNKSLRTDVGSTFSDLSSFL